MVLTLSTYWAAKGQHYGGSNFFSSLTYFFKSQVIEKRKKPLKKRLNFT